jgi:phage virion morphogenesis protein
MSIAIRVNARVVTAKLRKAARNAERMQDAFEDVAHIVLESIQRNFDAEGRPDRWPPRARRSRGSHKILTKSGKLRESISASVTPRGVDITSALAYSATHQHGRGAIPARPYMMLQDEDREAIRKAILDHLTGHFSR